MKKVILPLVALSIVSTSCSKKSNTNVNRISNFQSQTTKPIFIKKQVQDCIYVYSSDMNTYLEVDMLRDGHIKSHKIETRKLLTQTKLQSEDKSIITQTTEQFRSNELYKSFLDSDGSTNLPYKYQWEKITSEGNVVEVCPGVKKYNSDTIENASIVVNYAIDKTNKAIIGLGLGIDIKPVQVFITPEIKLTQVAETSIGDMVTKKEYQADNAYYKPWAHTITFLPHSEQAKSLGVFGEASLWEIPMVPSHEYGHHIFNMIVKNYSYSHESHKHSKYCFDNRIEKASKFGGKKEVVGAVRSANFHDTMGSLNEGFADLISFYTLDNSERSLKGVTCMELNRDVDSAYFQDFNRKIFSKNVIKIMSSPEVVDTPGTCADTDFQEIHALGAIFAHITDSFLNNFTTDKKVKLKIVMKWLQKINTEYDNAIKSKSIADSMQVAFEIMVATALEEFNQKATSRICDEVNSLYSSIGTNFQGDYLKCESR